jgi:hypothetical protein
MQLNNVFLNLGLAGSMAELVTLICVVLGLSMISFTDNQGNKFQRFHHAFTKRELKRLFKDAGFKIERCEVIDGRNIVLIGKKI